uniref:Uncharacterized protein n=1 Tax=Anopheles atroparvus TaxID=41427 RepID=A0A182JM53_ANOAO
MLVDAYIALGFIPAIANATLGWFIFDYRGCIWGMCRKNGGHTPNIPANKMLAPDASGGGCGGNAMRLSVVRERQDKCGSPPGLGVGRLQLQQMLQQKPHARQRSPSRSEVV